MPSSLSLLLMLLAIALAIAGATLLGVVLVGGAALAFEIYLLGSSGGFR